VSAALSVVAAVASIEPSTAADADPALPFDQLWEEARYWAGESNAAPEDCVFSFRFDPTTKRPRRGYAVTCDEPHRSPFYPWPAPSRPGVRFTSDDITAYARQFWTESGVPLRSRERNEEQLLQTCHLIVGFTTHAEGAEAIECHWRPGSVRGERANSGFLVETTDGRRVTSRLHTRIENLGRAETKATLARIHRMRSMSSTARQLGGRREVPVRVEGKVLARDTNRVMLRGQARPIPGEPPTTAGVVTTDVNIVVHHPSDAALRTTYYLGGTHCFREMGERTDAQGVKTPLWVYGPCPLAADQYWAFERHPPGRKTMLHGPYPDYGGCDRDRKGLRATALGVAGHCIAKAKLAFRMTQDGTLVVPEGAPPFGASSGERGTGER
jgi:hypothetical protein